MHDGGHVSFQYYTCMMDEQTTQFLADMSDLAINTTTPPSLVEQASQLLMYDIGIIVHKYWLPVTFPFGVIGKTCILSRATSDGLHRVP